MKRTIVENRVLKNCEFYYLFFFKTFLTPKITIFSPFQLAFNINIFNKLNSFSTLFLFSTITNFLILKGE